MKINIEKILLRPKTAAFLGGLVSGLVFAPVYFLPGLFSLSLLAYLLYHTASSKQAFKRAYLFGFGHFISSLWWVGKSLTLFNIGVFSNLLPIPAALAVAAICALYVGIAGYLTYSLYRKRRLIYWGIGLTLSWFSLELLRSFAPPFFPWNLIGYSLTATEELMQTAAIWQVWGLSICALLIGSLALSKKGITFSLSLLIGLFTYGSYQLQQEASSPAPQESLNIALVQANIQQSFKWHPQERVSHIHQHMALSPENADIIIWPETAVTFLLNHQEKILQFMGDNLKEDQTLILGTMTMDQTAEGKKFYNSIVSVDSNGLITQKYDKKRLVPFGEYFPFRSYFPAWVDSIIPGGADYSVGQNPVSLNFGNKNKALPLICYEAIFPNFVKKYLKDQKLLLNLTNDAWFDGTFGPYQHFAMARVRAVESGIPLVRIANTGITAVVDSKGRIVERLKTKQQGVLELDILKYTNQ